VVAEYEVQLSYRAIRIAPYGWVEVTSVVIGRACVNNADKKDMNIVDDPAPTDTVRTVTNE